MLFAQFFAAFAVFVAGGGGGGGLDVFFYGFDAGLELAGQGDDVFGAHAGQGAGVVAVEVDQGLEGALFAAAEEPVDRALLVGLQVIFEKAVCEVAADGIFG